MPYFTRAEIEAEIPPQFLLQALDDNSDGVEDAGVYDQLAGLACADVDGILGQRFPVPFASPVPPLVPRAARLFMLEKLYLRRGFTGEANPHSAEAGAMRTKLDGIAMGDAPLAPEAQRQNPSVSVISQPAQLHSTSNPNLF